MNDESPFTFSGHFEEQSDEAISSRGELLRSAAQNMAAPSRRFGNLREDSLRYFCHPGYRAGVWRTRNNSPFRREHAAEVNSNHGDLTLENLSNSFDGLKAVDGVSLSFGAGRVTSLIGPNGAGKTTIFNLITGFLRPDEGTISYHGNRLDGLPPWRIAQCGIGRLFQDVRVFERLSAMDNILAAGRRQPGENPLASIFSRKKLLEAEKKNREKARKWLQYVGLAEQERAYAEDLSYGQQKLLALARLLNNEAETLLLDEPTAGVQQQMVQSLLDLIRRLAEEGKTVVVIEHNMTVVMEVSDWVFFLDEGKLVSFGLPDDVLGDPEVRKAYIGI